MHEHVGCSPATHGAGDFADADEEEAILLRPMSTYQCWASTQLVQPQDCQSKCQVGASRRVIVRARETGLWQNTMIVLKLFLVVIPCYSLKFFIP